MDEAPPALRRTRGPGAIAAPRFDASVADQQKARANVLKHQRLWAEEQEHIDKQDAGARSSTEQNPDPPVKPKTKRGKNKKGKGE